MHKFGAEIRLMPARTGTQLKFLDTHIRQIATARQLQAERAVFTVPEFPLWKVQNPDSKTPAVPQVRQIGFQDSRIRGEYLAAPGATGAASAARPGPAGCPAQRAGSASPPSATPAGSDPAPTCGSPPSSSWAASLVNEHEFAGVVRQVL